MLILCQCSLYWQFCIQNINGICQYGPIENMGTSVSIITLLISCDSGQVCKLNCKVKVHGRLVLTQIAWQVFGYLNVSSKINYNMHFSVIYILKRRGISWLYYFALHTVMQHNLIYSKYLKRKDRLWRHWKAMVKTFASYFSRYATSISSHI